MAKELRQLYGGRIPKSYLPAHNHVMHTNKTRHGERGFRRFWIPPQWVGRGWSKCPCGWRGHDPKWKTHYAITEHVRRWKKRIKKHGNLEAAYREINKELAADYRAERRHTARSIKKSRTF
jgi:hypothetical protein